MNLALKNHSCCLDPNAPKFLTDNVLYSAASMKEVREAITNYDKEYPEAIKFVERVRDGKTASDNINDESNNASSDGDDINTSKSEDVDNDICVGRNVKKIFNGMGWYDGEITKVIGKGVGLRYVIRFDDREEED